MITDVKTVILTRDDLMQIFEDFSIEEIGLQHFSNMGLMMDYTQKYDLLIFVDDDGQMKIFKSRFGNTSTYDYVQLKNNLTYLIK